MRIKIIYLAAGNSRRFGGNKLLHVLDGRPMYLHLLWRLICICERHPQWSVVVVTQYQEIYDAVNQMEQKALPVCAVWSPESSKGVSYSIRAGLAEMEDRIDACAFFVADQPYLTEKSAEAFLSSMEEQEALLGCVRCGMETGNPAWFTKKYFPELISLTGDKGGKKVLLRHLKEVIYFPVKNAKELEDIDD